MQNVFYCWVFKEDLGWIQVFESKIIYPLILLKNLFLEDLGWIQVFLKNS